MLASFDDSDGVTPCATCGKVNPKGELISIVHTDEGDKITCCALQCSMPAAHPPKNKKRKK